MARAVNDFEFVLTEMKLRSARNVLQRLWISFIEWDDESGRWKVTLFEQKVLLEAIDIPHAIVEAEAIVSCSCFLVFIAFVAASVEGLDPERAFESSRRAPNPRREPRLLQSQDIAASSLRSP